jgi:hypothetical protein
LFAELSFAQFSGPFALSAAYPYAAPPSPSAHACSSSPAGRNYC